ncbi:hypothetical protein HMPREF9056_02439 [Actinomyces sp. oral taxon 170 str. F0386]|nr:hypothetical protein HMPREF9056_02439 [Actinomyces sp. oral taxon 170 str. F0386]
MSVDRQERVYETTEPPSTPHRDQREGNDAPLRRRRNFYHRPDRLHVDRISR